MSAPDGPAGDRGAAVVEFTLVSVLVVFLFLLVMQVGLVLHARNVLVSAAQDGARLAANADRSASDGVARTTQSIAGSLGPGTAERMVVTPLPASAVDGLPVGLMLVARDHGESIIYQAAAAYEQAVDWEAL